MTDAPNFNAANSDTGRQYEEQTVAWLEDVGYRIWQTNYPHPSGVSLDIVAVDLDDNWVGIECKSSSPEATQPGIGRSGTRKIIAGNLYDLKRYWRQHGKDFRYVLVTSHLPSHSDENGKKNAQRDRIDRYELDGDITVIHRPWASEAQ
ncbi:MAG: YraN family protein [Actinomycetes bacterium]